MFKFAVGKMILSRLYNFDFFHVFFVVRVDALEFIDNSNAFDKAYGTLIMSNKTSKQTNRNRFYDIQSKTLMHLKKIDEKIIAHDIAVSSAVTSEVLYSILKENNMNFSLTVSDKFSKVYLIKNTFFDILLDHNKNIIALYCGGIYLTDQLSWKYFISRILFKMLKKKVILNKREQKEYLLFDKAILKLINNNKIHYIDYNIFYNNILNQFNFIRAMNILNIGYFNKNLIKQAVENIFFSLKFNGIFLVGRTINNNNFVSFFKKEKRKFILLESINGGSEIEKIVLDLQFDKCNKTIK